MFVFTVLRVVVSVLSVLRSEVFAVQKGVCLLPGCDEWTLELAHLKHRGMGGNPDGSRNVRENLAGMCQRHHSMFDEGPWDLDDFWRLVVAALDPERQVECRWPSCFQPPVGGSDPKLCAQHVEVLSLDRPVPGRRQEIALLLRVLVERRDRGVVDVDVVEGFL